MVDRARRCPRGYSPGSTCGLDHCGRAGFDEPSRIGIGARQGGRTVAQGIVCHRAGGGLVRRGGGGQRPRAPLGAGHGPEPAGGRDRDASTLGRPARPDAGRGGGAGPEPGRRSRLDADPAAAVRRIRRGRPGRASELPTARPARRAPGRRPMPPPPESRPSEPRPARPPRASDRSHSPRASRRRRPRPGPSLAGRRASDRRACAGSAAPAPPSTSKSRPGRTAPSGRRRPIARRGTRPSGRPAGLARPRTPAPRARGRRTRRHRRRRLRARARTTGGRSGGRCVRWACRRYGIEGEPDGRVRFHCVIPLAGRPRSASSSRPRGTTRSQAAQTALRRVALWRATEHPAPSRRRPPQTRRQPQPGRTGNHVLSFEPQARL